MPVSSSPASTLSAACRAVAMASAVFLLLFASVAVGAPAANAAPAAATPSTAGNDFWVTFPPLASDFPGPLTLFIASDAAATGTITWTDSTTTDFSVAPGSVTTVDVPPVVVANQFTLPKDGVANVGIRITSAESITVYALNYYGGGTADMFVAIPTDALGTDYWAVTYKTTSSLYPGRVTVLATQDATTITVTPRQNYGHRTAGVPYEVVLNAGDAYSLTAQSVTVGADEITGTHVTSTAPVAVYGSNDTGSIGAGAGDLQAEQLFPVSQWGTDFVVPRLASATRSQPVRIVAATDGTVVSVDGTVVATINAGDFYEAMTAESGNVGMHVSTNHPVEVAQFMTNGAYGELPSSGDPSSVMIPPLRHYLRSYTVAVPGEWFGFNAINVVIPTAATPSLRLDGNPVSDSEFAVVAGTSFSVAQLPVGNGTHNVAADQPFGAFVYGAADSVSYAYLAGAGFSPIGFAHGATRTTNNTTPVITGTSTAAAGTTVTVTVDASTLTTVVASDGSWSVTAPTLANGTHTVSATVTDGIAATATQALTVDTVAPSLTINGGPAATGGSILSGTSDLPAGTILSILIDGKTVTTTVQEGGPWSVSLPTLAPGVYTATVTATDAAGNTTIVSQTVSVATPPRLAATGASAGGPLTIAGVVLLSGVILLALARWRRRSA